MAFANYYIKIGNTSSPNTELPLKYIKADSLQTTYETLDLDSYRDANGVLHRNALAHRCVKIEFETPYLYQYEIQDLMTLIRGAYDSATEQSLYISAYIPELDDYVTQRVYLVNTKFHIAQNSPLGAIYQPTRICFIAY